MLDKRIAVYAGIIAAGAVLVGCNSGSGGGDGMAQTSVAVTDAPVDGLQEVNVLFTGVVFQRSGGDRVEFLFDDPRLVPLLDLTGGDTEVLIDEPIPAGTYQWIRLLVAAELGEIDSFVIEDGGGQVSLFIPGGSQSGLQLNGPFELSSAEGAQFVVDFDLRKSINNPSGFPDYRLRPVLRITEVTETGRITGSVAPDLLAGEACTSDPATGTGAAVYVFEGEDQTPADIFVDPVGEEAATNPVTTASLNLDEGSGNFTYTAAFLLPGDFTVAFTCQAGDDDPETIDLIEFGPVENATVAAGAVTEVNFVAPD